MSSVYTNIQANNIYNTYSINNRRGNHFMQRLSTGLKIMTPKDNASVYAISERMRSQIRANEQANQNAQNDAALLKTAQGGISNTVDILKTLKERAINAANDSNLNQNRGDIATEVQQLGYQIDDNAYKVKYNNRAVLNGGFDTTVGRLNGASSVQDAAAVTENPNKTGTHAVYSLTGLYTWDSSTESATKISVDSTKLVELVKGNATSAGDTLFHDGDKITFSWKENGALVEKELAIDNTTEVKDLADLLDGSGNLKAGYQASSATNYLVSEDSAGTSPLNGDYDKVVLNSTTGDKLSTLDAGGAGVYAVGKKNVAITDFSVMVTNHGTVQTEAQEAIKLTGVQQGWGDKVGSNSVVSTQWFNGATDAGISGTNSSKLSDLMIYGTSATGDAAKVFKDSTSVKFEVEGSKGSKTIELSTGQTLEDLNKELEEIGIQASIVGKNQAVTYNGTNVTRSSGGNDSVLRSPSSALYFVGADGVDINSVKITPYKGTTAQDVNTKGISNAGTSASGFTLTRVQNRAEETAENSGPANSLTFFIGGEPNFGMEVTINKMDFKSLLGMSADAFAEKFLTREGAESALTTIDNALNKALNEQTKLGAIENRLGYASDNLTTMNTNTEESDSVLRDADIAKDMVQYAKYSVLSQIAQAMLAQANNAASGALSFLQQ